MIKNHNIDFKEYIIHYLRNTVICENYEDAINLKSRINRNLKIVTREGVVINDKGIESFGDFKKMPKKIKDYINM